ncbi:sensor histidine kinase [Chitinophagaceae bacterium MMS25-I14]
MFQQQKFQAAYDQEFTAHAAEKDRQIVQQQLALTRRESKAREKNTWIAAIAICAVFLSVLMVLLYRNSKHKQQLQARQIQTMRQEQEINNLTATIEGEEKERTRLGRELHDGVMVQLSTAIMNVKTLPERYRQLSSSEYVHTDYYRQIIVQMEEVAKELRFAAHNLMPGMLLQSGLAEAIFYFCNAIQKNTGVEFSLQLYGTLPALPKEAELSIYRIMQELVQNIIKHAKASNVIVQLSCPEGSILAITVEDNGTGFNTRGAAATNGMGLSNIESRTKALGGVFDLYSEKGNGTTVHIEFDFSHHTTPI